MTKVFKLFCFSYLIFSFNTKAFAKETFIKPFIDSLITDYQSNSSTKKLGAALPLLSMYHMLNFRGDQIAPYLKSIQESELLKYTDEAIAKHGSNRKKHEYAILKYSIGLDTTAVLPLVNELSDELKAAYYFAKGRKFGILNGVNGKQGKRALKACYTIAKDNDSLMGLQFWSLQYLGTYYYSQRMLDSALLCFKEQLLIAEHLGNKCKYLKGFGVHINGLEDIAHARINLGLCLDKAGNLFNAISYYEQGIKDYEKMNSVAGVCWGKYQLVNAYLDLGDYQQASVCARDLEKYWKNNNVPFNLDNGYIIPLFAEFDYFDIINTAPTIHFLLDQIKDDYSGIGRDGIGYNFSKAVVYSLRYVTGNMLNKVGQQISIMDTMHSCVEKFVELPHYDKNSYINYNQSMHTIVLAWKVALVDSNHKEHFKELVNLIRGGIQIQGHLVTNLVSIILHASHKHREELALLKLQLIDVKKNRFIIDQRKLHYQMSKAYEHLNQIDSAYFHFLKYDSLRIITQSLNYHAQLSELDKKFEIEKERSRTSELEKLNIELSAKRNRWVTLGASSILILLLAMAIFILWRKRNLVEKQMQQAEFQLLKRDNEQKEHALQNTTVELVKSNTNFAQLLQNIEQLSAEMKVETRKKARSILMDYRVQLQDETWQKFNLDFENANAGFYHELRTRFPSITDSELRIAAMHVSGLSNKEIAAITGQQIGSLHTHKSRLRKKLAVQNDAELMDLLKSVQIA